MARVGSPLPDPDRVRLAVRIQSLFLSRGQSLADPATADIHRTSMASMQLILSGALATGVINDAQHAVLAGMTDDAGTAPDVL